MRIAATPRVPNNKAQFYKIKKHPAHCFQAQFAPRRFSLSLVRRIESLETMAAGLKELRRSTLSEVELWQQPY